MINPDYELLDSGAGTKLERCGARVLLRPSSLCLWQQRLPPVRWEAADAVYHPGQGWQCAAGLTPQWELRLSPELNLLLRLQQNGQIGFFPEHGGYLTELQATVIKLAQAGKKVPRVLNLFAYTGMATVVCLAAGAQVTHVDSAPAALEWLRLNVNHNKLDQSRLRALKEDALQFIARERRRRSYYDLIIADPPNFSRSKKHQWVLAERVAELLTNCLSLLAAAPAALFLSNHESNLPSEVLINLIKDRTPAVASLSVQALNLPDQHQRLLPCGYLIRVCPAIA